MIKEEKVREQFYLAMDDRKNKKSIRDTGNYFKSDYIGRQSLISFVTGTLAYVLLVALWVLNNAGKLTANINSLDYVGLAVTAVMYYIAFMIVYLFLSGVVYVTRYRDDNEILKRYTGHLKKLNRLYSREEKLGK